MDKNKSTNSTKQIKNSKHTKELGQFYTTNYNYILQNMNIPYEITNIIEPFAGNGDLVNFVTEQYEKMNKSANDYSIECYDIEPKKDFILQQDTLNNPPNYKGKYVITNPPYLARNKTENKILFDKYKTNDLYKCFLQQLIVKNDCLGGIIIIPLNFWSSIRKSDIELRQSFLQKYCVSLVNIFEEKIFDDTTYTICSFQFANKNYLNMSNENMINEIIKINIYPSKKQMEIKLDKTNNYLIGGDIYLLPLCKKYTVSRLTKLNVETKLGNTYIIAKCIDDDFNNQLGLFYVLPHEIVVDNTPNLSARTYATLIIEPKISEERQQKLVADFNLFLQNYREKYHSLFLTNYRESKKDVARKRISFDLVYQIVEYLLDLDDNLLQNDSLQKKNI